MILEYCAGGDLAQAMTRRRQEPLEEALARALIKQLAAGEFLETDVCCRFFTALFYNALPVNSKFLMF
jgi:serine/threonine protein kinase